MAGTTFGKFSIRRELGRGAMGLVYEAEDTELGLDVALKVMQVRPETTPDIRRRQSERFYAEARALSGMRHPNVVTLYEQGEVSDRPYFSMELIRGTTLRDRLQFQGPLSVAELTRLALELCEALEHIHGHGVVHRDIKPENLMLMPDASVKLMDFGIAQRLKDGIAPSGGFHGSPAYMSPEQVAGITVDQRTDIYSLAVTLYEAACGKRAFTGENVAVITHKIASEYPAPPVGLPPFFQAILMRAMAKQPAHRYAHAAEMAHDIRHQRMPVWDSSPAPAPAPAPQPVIAQPIPQQDAVFLGSSISPEEEPLPSVRTPWGNDSDRKTCRLHPSAAGIDICEECRQPMCYACFLEVPNRGTICRTCAFGIRQ